MLPEGGFSGIYLDRKLLSERGPAVEAELSRILGEQPLVSEESELSFFSLEDYKATLAAKQ